MQEEEGSEQVEFALCVFLWCLAVFAIANGSFALYAAHFVGSAANEAARYAMVRGSSWNGASCASTSTLECTATSANVTAFVNGQIPPGILSSQLTISTTWPGTTSSGGTCDTENGVNSPNCVVSVQVSYNLSFPCPFFTNNTIPLSTTAEMPISQ